MEIPELKFYTRAEIDDGKEASDYNTFYPKALVDIAIRSVMENCSRAIRRCSDMQNELCTAYAKEVRIYKYKYCKEKAKREKDIVDKLAPLVQSSMCASVAGPWDKEYEKHKIRMDKWNGFAEHFSKEK